MSAHSSGGFVAGAGAAVKVDPGMAEHDNVSESSGGNLTRSTTSLGVGAGISAIAPSQHSLDPTDTIGTIPPVPNQGQVQSLMTPSISTAPDLNTIRSSVQTTAQNSTPFDNTPVPVAPGIVGISSSVLMPATGVAPPVPIPPASPAPPAPSVPLLDPNAVQGVALGIQQLERQQEELELRRSRSRVIAQADSGPQSHLQDSQHTLHDQLGREEFNSVASPEGAVFPFDESSNPDQHHRQHQLHGDDDTAPSTVSGAQVGHGSSGGDSADGAVPDGVGRNAGNKATSTFSRFLRTPLKIRHGLSLDRSFHGNTEDDPKKDSRKAEIDSDANKHVNVQDEDDGVVWGNDEVKPIVYGYLHKLGRNGHWQRRFFETDGECLTYYKSKKRSKILATLDLCKVGKISVDNGDPTGCTFTIQVADRPYYLRTENNATCNDWVINLNRVREARLRVGGFKLVQPNFNQDTAFGMVPKEGADRKRSESGEDTVVVVVSANRRRLKAITVDDEMDNSAFHQMLMEGDGQISSSIESTMADSDDISRIIIPDNLAPGPFGVPTALSSPVSTTLAQGHDIVPSEVSGIKRTSSAESAHSAPPSYQEHKEGNNNIPTHQAPPNYTDRPSQLVSHFSPVVLARWQKRRTNFQKLSMRLARWARRMKMLRCMVHEPDIADPPAFDYNEGFAATMDGDPRNKGPIGEDGLYHGSTIGHSGSFDGTGPSAWIGKEQQLQLRARGRVMSDVDEHFSSMIGMGESGPSTIDNEESLLSVPNVAGGTISSGGDIVQSSSSASSRLKSEIDPDSDFGSGVVEVAGESSDGGGAREFESREIA